MDITFDIEERKQMGKVNCSKVYVDDSKYGNGVFAKQDIKKGEIIETGIMTLLVNVDGNENPHVFTWSDEAKQVIKELIVLDNNTRDAQRIFFERLYTMWLNDGLEKITDAKAIDHFKREKNYINKTIFLSLPANVQEEMNYVETTYKNLLKGIGYITTDDENDIVPASLEAISKFRRLRNLNSDKIRYRYNAILNDFLQFIKEKNSESEVDKQTSK